MRRLILFSLLAGVLFFAHTARAQYYSWGADGPGMKWNAIRTDGASLIYPDTLSAVAVRTLFYIRHIEPDISHGFRHGPLRLPFVMHPRNFQSNGLVMFLPKRVEFLTTPAVDSYSMPWLKQLAAHEYRHAVQYNNLDRGVIRVLSYLLGEQGSTAGLLFMPLWAIEGDAVLSETAMSSFGRGLQPSFSMGYRAMGRVGRDRADTRYLRNPDKWFCGSYRDYIPDHYELGYQMSAYAYDRFGENIWDKVGRFAVRNPYVFATTRVGMQKYYDTNVNTLFRDTFDALERRWAALPPTMDSAEALTQLPEGNYTTYQWPLPLADGGVLALKTDFDRSTRFVRIDPRTGEERTICHTGAVSSRAAVGGGRVWWSEYRRSTLFDQRVASQLCYMDLTDGKPHFVAGVRNALYPTPAGDAIAWVAYAPDGRYEVVVREADGTQRRFATPAQAELHALAWDDRTQAFYVIVTDDSGMCLARIDERGVHALTEGAYISLSNLRAGGGKLYFGSIASGRDEAHCYDLATGHEYRITTSAYGSFSPAPWPEESGSADGGNAGDRGDGRGEECRGDNGGRGDSDDDGGVGRVLVTTYDRLGYRVAAQHLTDSALVRVFAARLPVDLLNPAYKRPRVVNLDSVRFSATDSLRQSDEFAAKRYRKISHAIHIHSWAPVAFDPFAAVDEHTFDANVGLTLLSQNLLSNTEAYASYGWNRDQGSRWNLGVRYFGLGVHLDLKASYGGNQLFYALSTTDAQGEVVDQPMPRPDKYHSIDLGATLPLYFQRGYHTRSLSLFAGWNYSNGMVAELDRIAWGTDGRITNIDRIGFREGLHKLAFGVGYSDYVRAAYRDFAPRSGYSLSANYTLNPANRNFSDLISFYGMVYLPGVAAHHSLTLQAACQTSVGGYKFPAGYAPLGYQASRLIPRGFTTAEIRSNDYTAASINYQLPVWYPDGGICSVLYFKRIRINVGGDFAQFRRPARDGMAWSRIWSVGGDVVLDLNFLRMPAAATTSLKLSFYRPSSGGVWVGAGLGLPF